MGVEPLRRKRVSTGSGGNHETRIAALEAEVTAMRTSVETAVANTQAILDVLTHAKTISGLMRRHGPRVIAALVGAAIATGKISAETGKSFLTLLGL